MFVKSTNDLQLVKTSEKLIEFLDILVKEIGEENIVKVITNNGNNYVLVGKLLEEKKSNLYWTLYVAYVVHCIELMFEDIGKLSLIRKRVQKGISFVGFI